MSMSEAEKARLSSALHALRDVMYDATGAELLCVVSINADTGLYVLAPKDLLISPLAMQRAGDMVDAIAYVNQREDRPA